MKFKNNLLIYKILIGILTFSFLIILITGISNLRDEFKDYDAYTFEEDHLSMNLRYNEYSDLANAARLAEVTNRKISKNADLYLDAGRYYNAARSYHAFQTAGDTASASKYLEKMNELEASGNPYLEPHIEDIKNILGITE